MSTSTTLGSPSSLCLACSSSLPPRRKLNTSAKRFPDDGVFLTRCCQRPICPACLSSNPRLARYDPCLRCLDGVGAVGGSAKLDTKGKMTGPTRTPNVDGSVRDEDVFILGDDGADESDDNDAIADSPSTPPPAYTDMPNSADRAQRAGPGLSGYATPESSASQVAHVDAGPSAAPSKYYIQPRDTLLGIALKVGVDVRTQVNFSHVIPSRADDRY